MREFRWQITEERTIDKMNHELAQACVDGLKNLQIHNYPQPINMEVSLLSVFSGIYGITNEQIRAEGTGNIRKFNKLTANADKNYLRSIRLWQDGKRHITAIDALEQYYSLFEKIGMKFTSNNEGIFSVFQGFKYMQLDEVDQTKIEQFLGLVKDTISANDERVYEYILNWFAFIVQNVGKKTETAIILKGLQGIGKNVFINVLCELLA
ncbi:MAG: hypothetical protein EZS28_045026, partial [Streblomastix strix]